MKLNEDEGAGVHGERRRGEGVAEISLSIMTRADVKYSRFNLNFHLIGVAFSRRTVRIGWRAFTRIVGDFSQ